MQSSILEQVKKADQRANYMKWSGRTGKIINFVSKKIPDHMETEPTCFQHLWEVW